MLLPVTVLEGGKTNSTVVNAMYDSATYTQLTLCFFQRGRLSHDVSDPSKGIGQLPASLGKGLAPLQAVDQNRHRVG
jgi:hypothetical protein